AGRDGSQECRRGCLEEKIGVAVALAGYGIAWFSSGYSARWAVTLTTAALYVVFGAVLGKTVGLNIAQVRVRRSISRVPGIWISPRQKKALRSGPCDRP